MHIPERMINDLIREHGLRNILREDYQNHACDWSRPGLRALASYRFSTWAYGLKNPAARYLVARFGRFLLTLVRNRYGIELYPTAILGRRLHIGHQNGIVVHKYAVIGDDCRIRQGVTLGIAGINRRKEKGFLKENGPVIGNRVDFGAGSMIVGKVRIGDDVHVGPNAVVLIDIPSDSTVMAPMSKIMRRSA